MNFSKALIALKAGSRIQRSGWNGKGMWLILVPATNWYIRGVPYTLNITLPWIGMVTANGEFVPWLASQTDLLSEDWEIVE